MGRSAFHSRRSLEEGGHVVCGEYAEDWKRVGEGAGGVNAALPCDGSSPARFSRNFPKFPPPGEAEVTQKTQRCGGPCAGILRQHGYPR